MIYLHCERCRVRRLFLPIEEVPPIDPNLACCSACGFSFGYRQVEVFEGGRLVVKTRPVLELATLAAGREAYIRERIESLKASGTIPEAEKARHAFDLTAGDPDARRRLTTEDRPGLDPGLAARILTPKLPGNRSGE